MLNPHDPEVPRGGRLVRGRHVPAAGGRVPPLLVPGRHNRSQMRHLPATAAAWGGATRGDRRGLADFGGLPQRLERFAVIDGRRSTTIRRPPRPNRPSPPWMRWRAGLAAGRRPRRAPISTLWRGDRPRARGAALFGSVAAILAGGIEAHGARFPAPRSRHGRGPAWCWDGRSLAKRSCFRRPLQPRSVLQFRQRGRKFVELVSALAKRPDRQRRDPRRTTESPWRSTPHASRPWPRRPMWYMDAAVAEEVALARAKCVNQEGVPYESRPLRTDRGRGRSRRKGPPAAASAA